MVLLLVALAGAQPPSAADLVGLSSIGDDTLSSDGRHLVFVETRRTFDGTAGPSGDTSGGWTRESVLMDLDPKSGVVRPLTWGERWIASPRWSPDGRWLAYERAGELVLLAAGGGEPRSVDLGGLHADTWDWIAPDRLGFTAKAEPSEADRQATWARGGTFDFGARFRSERLYTVDLEGGEPVPVTGADEHVTRWRHAEGAWLLAVAPSADPVRAWTEVTVELLDGGKRTVLEKDPDCAEDLAWSPKGTRAAWVVCDGGVSYPNRVMVRDRASGRTWELLADRDHHVEDVTWDGEGALLVRSSDRTSTRFERVDVASGRADDLGFGGGVTNGRPLPYGKEWIVRTSTPDRSSRLAVLQKHGTTRPLYDANPQAADWVLGDTRVVHWTGGEGNRIEGVLTRPPGATGSTPLLVIPHGGPDAVSQLGFDPWAQFFATRGYSVFRPNYRGSTGYGLAFYSANRGRLGEIELSDIEAGVDALIADGTADPGALFYGGWSWGGYLTVWTVAHTSRYKAAMAGAAVVDTVNQYVTSDINHGVIAEWEYQGRPWKGLDAYDRADASRVLGAIATPTLVLHGDADTRVPFAHGLTLYRALTDLGVDTELWVYPGANHGLGEPAHEVHRLEAWADWMARYGGPEVPHDR